MSEFLDELKVNRQRAEGFYVASIVNDLDLLEEYKLENSHFDKQSPWLFYFSLVSNMVKRKYEAIDHLSMDSFVDEFLSEKAKENYQKFGGYNTIELMSDIVDERNIEEYYENVLRYSALINVSNCGLDIEKHWASLKNLNYEEVSDYFETMISDVFTDITMGSDKVVDIKDNMWDMVVDADKGANRGLPVYSKLLDSVTNGQILGNITMMAGASGSGKAMPLSMKMPTPNGDKLLKDIKVGDYVYDRKGKPTKVLGYYPQGKLDVYKIEFADGRVAYSNDKHLWNVHDASRKDRNRMFTMTLKDIMEQGTRNADGIGNRWSIPIAGAVEKEEKEFEVHPYVVGALIGDGSLSNKLLEISSDDEFVVSKVSNLIGATGYVKNSGNNYNWHFEIEPTEYSYSGGMYGQTINKTRHRMWVSDALSSVPEITKLSGDKRIPKMYLEGSIEQRYDLLHGLMDTDGSISVNGGRYTTSFSTSSEGLAEDMVQLCLSLGIVASKKYYLRVREGRKDSNEYQVHLSLPHSRKHEVFSVPRKLEVANQAKNKKQRKKFDRVSIVNIEKMHYQEEMACILVDNEEHLFLANDFIVTHNTYLTIALTLPKMIEHREPVVIMANEEELGRWQMQLLVWVAHNVIAREEGNKHLEITKNRFLKGKFTPDIWEILEKAQDWINKHVADGLINFVNFTSFTMDRVIGVVKRYTARFDIKYFILDTLKLDNDVGSGKDNTQSWLLLQQNMVKLYNVIKASNRNAHIWVTYQLSKEPRRYLSQNSLGISKNVADVVSTLILIRNVFETEKEGKTGLKIHDAKGSLKTLDPDKDYMVLFLDKNRAGPTSKQIVLETDKDRNVIRDIGFTIISEDF